MDIMNAHKSSAQGKGQALAIPDAEQTLTQEADRSRVLACILVVPSDAEPLVSLLKELAASSPSTLPFSLLTGGNSFQGNDDPWLEHTKAAEFLGVSKSTLYRYASHQRIECRKLAGRLEYRQAVLEKLKLEYIRPARLSVRSGGIIPSTLSSGK